MRKSLNAACWTTFVVGGTLLTTALAMPLPAIARGHDDAPPGWRHGQKEGWNGRNEPPGQYRKHHGRDRDDRDEDRDDRSGSDEDNGGYYNGGYYNGDYHNGGYDGGYRWNGHSRYHSHSRYDDHSRYDGRHQRRGSYRVFSPHQRQNPRIIVRQRSYRGRRYSQRPGDGPPAPPQISIDQGRRLIGAIGGGSLNSDTLNRVLRHRR